MNPVGMPQEIDYREKSAKWQVPIELGADIALIQANGLRSSSVECKCLQFCIAFSELSLVKGLMALSIANGSSGTVKTIAH